MSRRRRRPDRPRNTDGSPKPKRKRSGMARDGYRYTVAEKAEQFATQACREQDLTPGQVRAHLAGIYPFLSSSELDRLERIAERAQPDTSSAIPFSQASVESPFSRDRNPMGSP